MATDRWWNSRRTRAAQMVAEDALTDEQIAKECGRSRMWLHNLKHDDRFKARVVGLVDQLRAELASRGVRERLNRVDDLESQRTALQERKKVLQRVIDERAEAGEQVVSRRNARYEATPLDERDDRYPDGPPLLPGVTTGVLARGMKAVGRMAVETWEYDAALLSEMRGIDAALMALSKQAAQELGQWTEKRELTGKNGGPLRLLWDDGEEV